MSPPERSRSFATPSRVPECPAPVSGLRRSSQAPFRWIPCPAPALYRDRHYTLHPEHRDEDGIYGGGLDKSCRTCNGVGHVLLPVAEARCESTGLLGRQRFSCILAAGHPRSHMALEPAEVYWSGAPSDLRKSGDYRARSSRLSSPRTISPASRSLRGTPFAGKGAPAKTGKAVRTQEGAPLAKSRSPRALGTNPRARGTNPRAKGTNPRAAS